MSSTKKFVFLCSISFFIITSVIGDGNHGESHSSIRNGTEYFAKNTTKESIINKSKKPIQIAEGVEVSQDFSKNSDKNFKHIVTAKDNIPPLTREVNIESNEYTTKSSIVARKGVEDKTLEPVVPPVNEKIATNNSTISINTTSKLPDSSKLNDDKNKTEEISSTTSKSNIQKTTKKPFRPKPTATPDDDVDVGKPFPSMATKTPPLGLPSKINYVTPVVLTFLVGSIFIGFIIFLYKNGREYWEKRHYSRMDFLIDGMYNE